MATSSGSRSRPSPSWGGSSSPLRRAVVSHSRSSAGPEAEVVEHLGPQVGDQVAHVLDRSRDALSRLGERGALLVVGDVALEAAKREEHRGEAAGRAVVQVLCEPPPLSLLGLDHARERLACGPRRRSASVAAGRAPRIARARAPSDREVRTAIAAKLASDFEQLLVVRAEERAVLAVGRDQHGDGLVAEHDGLRDHVVPTKRCADCEPRERRGVTRRRRGPRCPRASRSPRASR